MHRLRNALLASISLFSCLFLASCSGGEAGTPAAAVAPQADFTLSTTPSTVTLASGGPGQQISVTASPVNGFATPVSVTLTGLPTGVTAQPATLTLTPGTAQNVVLTASAATASGAATFLFIGTSGTLTHTASVAATIASTAPDFMVTLSPPSLNLVPGVAGSAVSVSVTSVNTFASQVIVAITGLPSGVTANPATIKITPGTPQNVTLTASAATALGASTVTFTGTSGSLSHTASLSLNLQSSSAPPAPDVPTYHYDVARDGLNAQETILTQANVNSTQFGKVGFDTVDGKVDAQPLYLSNVSLSGTTHNVLYTATEHGSVYAFDADSNAQLWKTSIIPSGEMTSDDHGCNQISAEIGITSTPVIDRKQGSHGTIFVVGMSKDAAGTYHQRLHALDLTTGADVSGSPVEISAKYPGTGDNSQSGNVVFDPGQYAERAALLLLNGNIYTSWTSHCDAGLYTGWIIAYSESTLQQTQLLNLTPNGHMGSIWMAGDGLAADSTGNIFLLDANGTFDLTLDAKGYPTQGDYGNAMLRLSTAGTLSVSDYFETFDTTLESGEDLDLGSGGEILLPDQKDAAGAVHHLMIGAGKDKTIYVADRDNMGKFSPATTLTDSNLYQKVTGALGGAVFASPAYFNNTVYYGAVGDALKAFPITNAKLANTASSQSSANFAYPGSTPAISANGTQNGIVWAVESSTAAAAVLHAYDSTDLGNELYNSNEAASGRDSFGNGNKFIAPLIVNGRVYIGTQTGVAVFGLLK